MQKRMKWQTVSFDWNQARAFLVTAEEGSLSAAARALGLTQPTLGRQVAALEENLGVTLFERVGRTLALTQSGIELLDHVRSMGEAAGRISLTASGQSQAIDGRVTIAASDGMSAYLLPSILMDIRQAAPAIEIEIVSSNTLQDLMRREADIAIRHVRPEQPDLIAKLVKETSAHIYAATSYLETHGRPETVEDLADEVFIGVDNYQSYLPKFNARGLPLTADNFKLSSNSGVTAWELVRQGLGLGIMVEEIGDITPEVECLSLRGFEPFSIPVWLATHRELHTSRRIRLVFDHLAEALA